MELTAEQAAVVDHETGRLRVTGAAGTGKTTALQARYLRLVRHHPARSVLVVCRNRAAANRFLEAVLPELAGGFDALPITSAHGLAYDLVTRHRGPVRLVSTAQQWQLIRRLLSTEVDAGWPALGHLLKRRAFADEVLAAVTALESRVPGAPEPEDAGWREVGRFAESYSSLLEREGKLSAAGLLAQAHSLLDHDGPLDAETSRYEHVLVDDYDTAGAVTAGIIDRLSAAACSFTVAGNPEAVVSHAGAGAGAGIPFEKFQPRVDLRLTQPFRHPDQPSVVCCRHPSVEPEAIAGELLKAHHERATPWSGMAVLVRSPRQRGRSIARALARHGIPVAPVPAVPYDDPAVAAVIDMLRWLAGDETALHRLILSPLARLEPAAARDLRHQAVDDEGALERHPRLAPVFALYHDLRDRPETVTPAELAFEIWERGFGVGHGFAGDEGLAGAGGATPDADGPDLPATSIDAMVAFLDALNALAGDHPPATLPEVVDALERFEIEPDPWRITNAGAGDDQVTIASIESAAGREWHTVIIAGCVEGELPRITARAPLFDPAALADRPPPAPAERRHHSLQHERHLFATARNCATHVLVGTAAPQPGVLLSRFVEGWNARPPDLPMSLGEDLPPLPHTAGAEPVWPDGLLHLSASQLDTYDDCPLRYAYQYALGARGTGSVHADLGSLVHDVLAEFLDPDRPGGPARRTREDLMAIASRSWREDIARYRPQVEEIRRDYFTMLEQWWEAEGEGPQAPEVLDVERWFEVNVGPHSLSGAIDRIDRADDGAGIRIVDYKTGKKEPGPNEMPDNLQLAVYHLAATRDAELMAMGRPTQLRLLYLRTMHTREQEITSDHAEVTEQRILDAAGQILAENFEPSVDANCHICEFHRLCPLQPEGREVVDV